MNSPVRLNDLVPQIQDLYRPSLRGHWQRRVVNRLRRWLDREDAELFWTAAEEDAHAGLRVALPDREHPPRWLFFSGPLNRPTVAVAEMLARHVATVAGLMEADTAPHETPVRWRALLTPRQAQVALLAADGASNEQISSVLGIAVRTVARLLQETFLRLNASNRQALAAECALGRPPTPFVDRWLADGLSEGVEPEEVEES